MYYETDGDSGYYAIELFATEAGAVNWKRQQKSAYGRIKRVKINGN